MSETLAGKVKELEDSARRDRNELGQLRATLIVNFGKTGRHTPGLVKEDMGTEEMMGVAFRHFIAKIKLHDVYREVAEAAMFERYAFESDEYLRAMGAAEHLDRLLDKHSAAIRAAMEEGDE
jgi:hypothetical protein